MTRLYLSEPGSVAHKRGGHLTVEKDGATVARVPLAQVEQVVLVGKSVQLTTALLVDLCQRGVQMSFLSRSGRFYGTAGAGAAPGVLDRIGQHAFLADPERAAGFARALIGPKLRGQEAVLAQLGAAPATCQRLSRLATIVSGTRDVGRIRGYEGSGAAAYWQALADLLPPVWGFHGRRHHPPPDPVNALLSFGYTLLLHELVALVQAVGLDGGLAALHTPQAGRPSLALDLEEPFRPLGVDVWVLEAVLGGAIVPEHFAPEPGRVLLTPIGRRRFLELYEQAMGRRVRHVLARGRITVRQSLELHVRLAARLFTGGATELEAPQWR